MENGSSVAQRTTIEGCGARKMDSITQWLRVLDIQIPQVAARRHMSMISYTMHKANLEEDII